MRVTIFIVLLFSLFNCVAQTVQENPSLIPFPKQLQWKKGAFSLKHCRHIVASEPELKQEAIWLKAWLKEKGVDAEISAKPMAHAIVLRTDRSMKHEEGYHLRINKEGISISGADARGIFYGIQTLRQLALQDMIPAVEIADEPAFPWRGYMVDVGRNFMSVHLLKEQIDVMAAYKLNIFHFHLTEDIAWRVEIPGYPQLVAPSTMIRNPGSFYSVAEMKELIAYCRERHILMVPEIDMPGHSAAFTRAMGADMQSEKGKAEIRKIMKRFCETYDLPYIHIGGDEVKISDSSFLPDLTHDMIAMGKKVLGWDPGGNHLPTTIRQLWMRDVPTDKKAPYLDSRHLYLNHMDPHEAVTTIYKRQIGGVNESNGYALGGIFCLWHDRKVRNESDLMTMNPVYPAMLSFAERSWKGGGKSGWVTQAEASDQGFTLFEQRLMDHKQRYFSDKPFLYQRQSGLIWKLYGPYDNEGDLGKRFKPELNAEGLAAAKEVMGATVVLRHFWDPLVKGVLDSAREQTTWYAERMVWSDADTMRNYWVGFNNFSRSYTSDSPPEGQWNTLSSKLFVNGQEIAPPEWARPGAKGELEQPLIDEGYEYRKPTIVPMKKGWNRILVKLPVGSFKANGWNNPVKWMFTVVEAE